MNLKIHMLKTTLKLKMTLKTSVVPSRFCKSTKLLIAQVAC